MLSRYQNKHSAGWRALFLFLAALFVTSLACGPLGAGGESAEDGEEPAAAAVETEGTEDGAEAPAPTTAPEPTEAPAEEPAADEDNLELLQLDNPTDVESYRLLMTLTTTVTAADGTVSTETFTIEGAQDVASEAATYTISSTGMDAEMNESMTMTRIGQDQYLVLPDGSCISYNLGADELFDAFLDNDGMVFDSLSDLRRVLPDETINGIETRHYVFDEESIASSGAMVTLSEASGDVYLATDSDRVIRIVMTGRGSGIALQNAAEEGEVTYQLDFFDFGQVGVIELPAGCAAPGESEYPVLDDAEGLFSGGGLFSYTTAYSVAEVAAFYQDALDAEGWSGGDNALAGSDAALLNFSRGDEQLTITIAADEGSGRTAVAIVSTP